MPSRLFSVHERRSYAAEVPAIGAGRVAHDLDGAVVEVLEAARADLARCARGSYEGECIRFAFEGDREPGHRSGKWKERELGLHYHTERPLAPDEPVHGLLRHGVAHGVLLQRGAAQLDELSIRQRHAERDGVVARGAVA